MRMTAIQRKQLDKHIQEPVHFSAGQVCKICGEETSDFLELFPDTFVCLECAMSIKEILQERGL